MKKITRRTFMKVMGTTAAAVGLSACGGSAGSTAASASNAASSTAVLHRPRPKHLPLKLPILSRKTAFTAK